MKRIILPFSLASIIALSSCSKVQDMHDATMKMSNTTTDMANTTNELANTTAQTKSLMQEIYDSGRQGASLDLRNKLFDIIVKSDTLEEKATNAGLYFMAFEYELWSNNGTDSLEGQRLRLMKDAAEEFFCHLLSITHWKGVDPFAGKNPIAMDAAIEHEKASFNAFALTLEKSNRKQDNAAAGDLDSASMRNMIETALLAGKKIESGEAKLADYPAYVEVILGHRDIAIELLKARYQMMGLAILRENTDISNSAIDGAAFKFFGAKWSIDVSPINEAKNNKTKFRLNEALRTQKLLADIGAPVTSNESIRYIFKNAVVNVSNKKQLNPEIASKLSEDANDMKRLLAEYTSR